MLPTCLEISKRSASLLLYFNVYSSMAEKQLRRRLNILTSLFNNLTRISQYWHVGQSGTATASTQTTRILIDIKSLHSSDIIIIYNRQQAGHEKPM